MKKHKSRDRQPRKPNVDSRAENPVFSYSSKRSGSERTAGRKDVAGANSKERTSFFHRLPGYVAILAIIVSVCYLLTLTTTPKIVAVNSASTGSLLRSTEAYRQEAQNILAGSILNRTKFTINTSGFEQAMKDRFPELSQASLTLPLVGRRPIVELAASQPQVVLSSGGKNYILDTNGKAIIAASDLSNLTGRNLPVVVDQSNVPIELGKSALTNKEIAFITELNAQLVAAKLPIESLSMPQVANELRLRLKGLPYYVRFDMQNDPRQSAGAFIALKKKLDADGTVPAEYIDLRIVERAYYK